ncbi:MAG: shikimate kinase [Candidatus Lambdaproteobacteria bacterium]|nr:shikimate kinase [Candidatus Lambdaproteobacteria bacterium]
MNLILIGMMGSGKSSVGRRIARRLGYRFLDTDRYIEERTGRTIAQLFAEQGEPHFRELETRLASHLHLLGNHVVATGGGMAIAPGNLDLLRGAGTVVFLDAEIDDMLARLEHDTRRPKLREGELRETVIRLLAERRALYEQADLTIKTAGLTPNRVAGLVIRRVAEHLR